MNTIWIFVFVITYLTMPLVPLMMLAMIYSISNRAIEGEILNSNKSILKQLQYNIDSRLTDVEQLTIKIGMDSRVTPLLDLDELNAQHRYLLRDIIQDCNSYLVANTFIKNFYVYMHNSNVAFSPNGTYDEQSLYDLWYIGRDISRDDLRISSHYSEETWDCGREGKYISPKYLLNNYLRKYKKNSIMLSYLL